jgi:hypothetical protein
MNAREPSSSVPQAKIFINYRREDAGGYAGRLSEWLTDHFGSDHVFMDISAIEPGVDFVTAIERAVAACEVVLVVIGRHWLNCHHDGQRRLDNPNDFVRLEIAAALSRNVFVLPVLVEGATVPREQDLPDNLKALARRNALELSNARWEFDVGRLIDTLAERLEERPGHKVSGRRAKKAPSSPLSLRRYWQLFPVRFLAGLLLLTGAFIPQLHLLFRPEPKSLQDASKFFFQKEVALGRQRLTIKGPVTNSDERLLLSRNGKPDEDVELHFDWAHIDNETAMQFEKYNPPGELNSIDYVTTTAPERTVGKPCTTAIEIRYVEKPPAELYFYQLIAPGDSSARRLDMRAAGTGGDLSVKDMTLMPRGGTELAHGCRKELQIGGPESSYPVGDDNGIGVVAAAGRDFYFIFSRTPNSPDGFFEPFQFGSAPMNQNEPARLRASEVEITTLGEKPTSILSISSSGELLNLDKLEVGADKIRINVSGKGYVQENGKDYLDPVDPVARMKRHVPLTTLLAAVNVALLVWFIRLLFVKRQPIMQ